jgi:hypothetical protein
MSIDKEVPLGCSCPGYIIWVGKKIGMSDLFGNFTRINFFGLSHCKLPLTCKWSQTGELIMSSSLIGKGQIVKIFY